MERAGSRKGLTNQGYGAHSEHRTRISTAESERDGRGGYYDVPMLKRSPWRWEISSYFFFGGLSGGAYLLARLAEHFGGRRMAPVTKIGTAVAALSLVPCAPLLVKDLGDMSRFHHMLRVFKPQSPMSLGTWTLTTYSGATAVALLRELLHHDEIEPHARGMLKRATRRTNPVLIAVIDGAGIPAALMMTSYTGVLLSCTATPLWTRNPWLSPLFVSSALSTGTAAIQLGMACCGRGEHRDAAAGGILNRISAASRTAEAITLAGYLHSIRGVANPLAGGKETHHTGIALAALVAPELIQFLLRRAPARLKMAIAAGAVLVGGISLRRGILNAGNESSQDPEAARRISSSGEPS